MVKASAEEWFDSAWNRCSREPESAGEDEVFRSTYKSWIGFENNMFALHLERCIPPVLQKQLMKIRLGCHYLNIHEKRKEGVERQHRYCTVCYGDGRESSGREVEDVMHFMMYCVRGMPL
jgi:hypothetical protein